VPKILIFPSGKSIDACIHTHGIQICAYMHAYMDFSDGEIHIVGTSSDFSIGEIQTCAIKYGI